MTRENLLPDHRAERRRLEHRVNAWAMGVGVFAVLVGGFVIGAHLTKARPPAMPVSLTQEVEVGQATLAFVRGQIEALNRTREARGQGQLSPKWSQLLEVIAYEADGKVRLDAIQIEPGSGTEATWSISMVGAANAAQAPASLATRLEATGLFETVRHGLAPQVAGASQINFHLDCVVAPGDQP